MSNLQSRLMCTQTKSSLQKNVQWRGYICMPLLNSCNTHNYGFNELQLFNVQCQVLELLVHTHFFLMQHMLEVLEVRHNWITSWTLWILSEHSTNYSFDIMFTTNPWISWHHCNAKHKYIQSSRTNCTKGLKLYISYGTIVLNNIASSTLISLPLFSIWSANYLFGHK